MSFSLSFARSESPFLLAWNRFFGVRSSNATAGIAQLCRQFSNAEFRLSFDFWRSIWRSISDFSNRSKNADGSNRRVVRTDADVDSDGWSKYFVVAGAPESFQDENFNAELEPFVLQTYAAQSCLSILSAFFNISDVELREIFGATPFDWGASLRPLFESAARKLAPLAADELAPFGECYSRLFSARRRRTLGEFYTPPELADYLRDLAFASFAEGRPQTNAFPSVLDPTCGGGVFLTSVLKRRLKNDDDPANVLNDVAGFDASPFAVLTARANLAFATTSNVSTERRSSEFQRIAAKRRAERSNEPIFPIFLLDSVRNRVPKPSFAVLNAPWNGLESTPDFFDSQRWERSPQFSRRFDVVLGNPPWIAWDKLSLQYRDATKKYWLEYGLFSLSGKEARLGGGKKELASLLVSATIDRRLDQGGVLAFVLPKSLFQTRKAGDGFRRFGWNSTDFRVLQIDDFSEIDVFPNVLSKVATFCVRKGEKTSYPLPVRRWRPAPPAKDDGRSKKKRVRNVGAQSENGVATPISPHIGAPLCFNERQPFPTLEPAQTDAERRETSAENIVKQILLKNKNKKNSDYVAKLGANAAGGSGVFWLEKVDSLAEPFVLIRNLGDVGRKKVASVVARVESALVFPLLRWRDVDEFFVREPETAILLPQNPQTRRGFDEETMRRDFPATFDYLTQFENELRNRAAYRKFQHRASFWSLYNVDVETFAPIKVVWRRMDSTLRAAVVQFDAVRNRPIIPQETLATIAVDSLDEADYLAAFLNSEPIRRRVAQSSVPGSKSFGSPGILETLGVPRFDPNDVDFQRLAEFGRRARLARQ